jgi:hypothetical protein
MGRNDQNKGKWQQNQLIIMPILLCKQKKDTSRKQQERYRTPVMRPESVAQGQDSNQKCQSDHAGFKPEIVYDIHPENRQPGQKKRQNGAMYRTRKGSSNSNKVSVYPLHKRPAKIEHKVKLFPPE